MAIDAPHAINYSAVLGSSRRYQSLDACRLRGTCRCMSETALRRLGRVFLQRRMHTPSELLVLPGVQVPSAPMRSPAGKAQVLSIASQTCLRSPACRFQRPKTAGCIWCSRCLALRDARRASTKLHKYKLQKPHKPPSPMAKNRTLTRQICQPRKAVLHPS